MNLRHRLCNLILHRSLNWPRGTLTPLSELPQTCSFRSKNMEGKCSYSLWPGFFFFFGVGGSFSFRGLSSGRLTDNMQRFHTLHLVERNVRSCLCRHVHFRPVFFPQFKGIFGFSDSCVSFKSNKKNNFLIRHQFNNAFISVNG